MEHTLSRLSEASELNELIVPGRGGLKTGLRELSKRGVACYAHPGELPPEMSAPLRGVILWAIRCSD
jgi:hypothetical protein